MRLGIILLCVKTNSEVGVVMSHPRNYYISHKIKNLIYWVYDVVVGNELITDIPQEFYGKD